MLLFLQFSCNTFYDPARRALVPTVVPAEQLPLATTLDSFAWSLMGAFGASLGGLAVSAKTGPQPRSYLSACCHKLGRSLRLIMAWLSQREYGASLCQYALSDAAQAG